VVGVQQHELPSGVSDVEGPIDVATEFGPELLEVSTLYLLHIGNAELDVESHQALEVEEDLLFNLRTLGVYELPNRYTTGGGLVVDPPPLPPFDTTHGVKYNTLNGVKVVEMSGCRTAPVQQGAPTLLERFGHRVAILERVLDHLLRRLHGGLWP
jgi:hypothetical protein